MSPRSQIASSGKSEIAACSAAWRAPMKCSPRRRRASSKGAGAAHQRATVSKWVGGRSRGSWSMVSPPWMRLRSKPTTRWVTLTRPSQASSGPSRRSARTSRISVSFSVSGVVK